MIGFFPPLYEDELVYSWMARYMVYSGYSAIADAYVDIYGRKTISPSMMLINIVTSEATSVLLGYKPIRQLILDHTMFPEYARFIELSKRERLLEECDFSKVNWSYMVMYPVSDRGRFLKYCPECAKEDRQCYGETYWHRVHQISNIRICTKHKTYLLDSTVVINWNNTRLKNAEIFIPEDEASEICDDNTVKLLACYLEKVFYSDIYSDESIGLFLNDNINKTFKHDNGDRRLYALYAEYNKFYASLGEGIMTIDYMSKLLRGRKGAYYYICQLGLFEGIEANDLLEGYVKSDDSRVFRAVAEMLNEPIEVVERIGAAVLNEYTSNGGKMIRTVRCEKKLVNDDKKLVRQVKQIVADIYGKGDKRPRKVSVKAVARALGIDDHKLKKMKLCMAEINHYYETQEQYWAREIIWAVEQIQMNNEPMNYRHIRNYVNLKKENIKGSINDIKVRNEKVYNIISRILN